MRILWVFRDELDLMPWMELGRLATVYQGHKRSHMTELRTHLGEATFVMGLEVGQNKSNKNGREGRRSPPCTEAGRQESVQCIQEVTGLWGW